MRPCGSPTSQTPRPSLSRLIERVLTGEEVIIGKSGEPVARLVPFERDSRPRDLDQPFGEGQVRLADDFDELPEDLLQLFTTGSSDAPVA